MLVLYVAIYGMTSYFHQLLSVEDVHDVYYIPSVVDMFKISTWCLDLTGSVFLAATVYKTPAGVPSLGSTLLWDCFLQVLV